MIAKPVFDFLDFNFQLHEYTVVHVFHNSRRLDGTNILASGGIPQQHLARHLAIAIANSILNQ